MRPAEPAVAERQPRTSAHGIQNRRAHSLSVTLRWEPLSVRGRIIGWSVLLLTAALAASTTATHLLDIQQFDGWVEVASVLLLVGSALAWVAAGRMLRPIRDTTELARRITETDISGRIPIRDSEVRRRRNEITELAYTLNRMFDRLEAAATTQRQFLADAGHELRTPITIIQGNLDTLTTATDEDAQTLEIVADELTRMTRLVDELTLLATSERPDFLRPEPVDLSALTTAMAAKVRALVADDEARFTLTGTASGIAVLDPQRVTQAVMQLAANAVTHTPPGTPVEISSAVSGAAIEFRVADRGPGIPAQQRERIFERFARLDPRHADGTGLGLSIVAAIAAAHGGSVGLADTTATTEFRTRAPATPGTGATFVLTLPLRRPVAHSPFPAASRVSRTA